MTAADDREVTKLGAKAITWAENAVIRAGDKVPSVEQLRTLLAAAEARGVERGRTEAAEAIARLEAERDEARAETRRTREVMRKGGAAARETVDQLVAERDEARVRANEAARLSAEARDQADDLRRTIADLREQVAIIDESRTDMTVIQLRLEDERDGYRAESLRLGAKAQQLVRLATDLRAQRDTAIDLLDQLTDDDPCDYDHHDYCQTHHLLSRPCANARAIALVAAVDQTAPSSPLETPQTADDGEAGVVEGAGGSEAAEGVGGRVERDPVTGETRAYQNSGASITIPSGTWTTTIRWLDA